MVCTKCGRAAQHALTHCPACGGKLERAVKPSISAPEPVGTHLASLIPDWAKSMKGGCGCKDWELKMNRWGVDACEKNREQIVNHLMSQQEHLIPPLRALPAFAKRAAANRLLDKAIKLAS